MLSSQRYDASGAKHYNYFRDYDPSTGRYVESDPLGLAAGVNSFSYVEGNPLTYIDEDGQFANLVIGAITGVAAGYAIAWITGDQCYGWKDALGDAALGAVGAGIVSKLNKFYRVARLRGIARERGLQNMGRSGYTETWRNPDSSLEELNIKFEGGKSANLHPDSKVPRFSYRVEAGKYWDPFTDSIGPRKGPVAHTPLEPRIPTGAGLSGAAAAALHQSSCECQQ